MKEITLDKDGICEILGVTKISLKKIEKNNKLSHNGQQTSGIDRQTL